MRFSSAVAGLVLLSAPYIATAQESWGSSGSWAATTTTEYQATTTITMTLLQVNATVTSHVPQPTGYNTTSSALTSALASASYTYTAPSYNAATVNPSATPSVCSNCLVSNDASSGQIDVAAAALAGVAALVWVSL